MHVLWCMVIIVYACISNRTIERPSNRSRDRATEGSSDRASDRVIERSSNMIYRYMYIIFVSWYGVVFNNQHGCPKKDIICVKPFLPPTPPKCNVERMLLTVRLPSKQFRSAQHCIWGARGAEVICCASSEPHPKIISFFGHPCPITRFVYQHAWPSIL